MPTTKRKRDISHRTCKKHQLQLFKNFWNDTFENSNPSINLNISTILICFRFTSCLETRGFCCLVEQNHILFTLAIWCTYGLPVTFPCATICNQLGDKQINPWQWEPSVLSAYFLPLYLCLYIIISSGFQKKSRAIGLLTN